MSETMIKARAVEDWMPLEAKELHRNSPGYFLELIENGVLENITSLDDLAPNSIKALEGGTGSACFLFENNRKHRVLKLRTDSLEAEAEALAAWREAGAYVPEVLASGVIPSTTNSSLPVKYMVIEGIVDEDGHGMPLVSSYIDSNPLANAELSCAMGRELAKMHQVTSHRSLGPFGDTKGEKLDMENWNQFLNNNFIKHKRFLTDLGFDDDQVGILQQTIAALPFPKEGVYVHNDFATRNTLTRSTDPLVVCVIDPDPLIGDRHWDLAKQQNRQGIARKKLEADPDNKIYQANAAREDQYVDSLFSGYTSAGQTIDDHSLTANTLVYALMWQGRRERVAEQRFGVTEGKSWLVANREVIREQANKVLSFV